MRYVFRALVVVVTVGLLAHLSLAQKSIEEAARERVRDASNEGEVNRALQELRDKLGGEGSRDTHQGPDNPMQGNRSSESGRFGGPDPYGSEDFEEFITKAERQLQDPQWQLKLDLQNPKSIVINHADGTSKEYWYVLFRVINDNTRQVRETRLQQPNPDGARLSNPPSPLHTEVESFGDLEGVPVEAHLDFEFHVFTRDIEKSRYDTEWPVDPENEVLSPEALDQRRSNMKKVYKPVSDHYVLQKIADSEGLYEWMGNYSHINEPVTILHPLSDFQRQIGFARELDAPDLSGPRCLPYRSVVVLDGERSESTRYVAVYENDLTFAGIYGEGDELPDGARLVDDPSDEMWGKLTQRRYRPGDCIDRLGRPLRANSPGYLSARVAGGRDADEGSYGVIGSEHPAVGQPVQIPHVRVYREGDRVLFDHDTGIAHDEYPNQNFVINGKIVGPKDPRYNQAEEINTGSEKFSGDVVGRPVKMVDHKGRAIRKYLVTYQAGDVLSQDEWDIWSRRLGPGILSRYSNTGDIVGRPLTADDPVVGLPKIKMGRFVGDDEANAEPEVIQRGIDTGRRGDEGEVILDLQDYTTGRRYDPRLVDPVDFLRDPDGEFFTHRIAPTPPGARLNPGEHYVYAPLGNAEEDAVPVPAFDQYGAQMDYVDELSGNRIPLKDAEGNLVRDAQDQILYLKEYEYEYVYLYQYEVIPRSDNGYRGEYGGDRFELVTDNKPFVRNTQPVRRLRNGQWVDETVEIVLPLTRRIYENQTITTPVVVDGYEVEVDGEVRYVTETEYQSITGGAPGDDVVTVKIVQQQEEEVPVVVGVYDENTRLEDGQWAESESEARERAEREGGEVISRPTIEFVDRFRREKMAEEDPGAYEGDGPGRDDFDSTPIENNGINLDKTYQTWSRWTVPPPLVYQDANRNWQVLTRFADKVGPANRWDGKDAPRFLTRYISEMWGVAIFENVSKDWDYANVYVRGLRGRVSNAGLKVDGSVPDLKSPADSESSVEKTFFNPRYVGEEWVYRVRFERLGDGYENYRDLIRRVRTFWYRESDEEID